VKQVLIVLVVASAMAVVVWVLSPWKPSAASKPASASEEPSTATPFPLSSITQNQEPGPKGRGMAVKLPNQVNDSFATTESLLRHLKETLAQRGDLPPGEISAALEATRNSFLELPPDEAAAALIAELESGIDLQTGLPLLPGSGGSLAASSTYRVALLDWLGQSSPTDALAYSRQVLQQTTSPDEYALAMRNIAWAKESTSGDAELTAAFNEMLSRPDWLISPSRGYLEAIDVAVAVGGADMLRQIASLVGMRDGTTHPADFAASLALDRMLLRQPELVTSTLAGDPTFLDWSPKARARLMSRSDIRQPVQKEALYRYLSNPAISSAELAEFGKRFPNLSFIRGNRLVTTDVPLSSFRGIDEPSLNVIAQWRSDPALQHAEPALEEINRRLQFGNVPRARPPSEGE